MLFTGGNMLDALNNCENNQMNEERVRFYTAEIVLALSHIHKMGMIYRDLKVSTLQNIHNYLSFNYMFYSYKIFWYLTTEI